MRLPVLIIAAATWSAAAATLWPHTRFAGAGGWAERMSIDPFLAIGTLANEGAQKARASEPADALW